MREPQARLTYEQAPISVRQTLPLPTKKNRSPLHWWYRLSTPDEGVAISQDVVIPRERLASILLLVIFGGVIAFIPAALTSDGLHVVPPFIGMFLITCLATFLNKRGKVTLVGLLIVGAFDIALIHTLLSYSHFELTNQQILYTLVQAANGDTNVRVPLAQQHALWQVGVGLNTLLARLQSARFQQARLNERELLQIRWELKRLVFNIQKAKRMQTPFWFVSTGTDIDPLLSELVGYALLSPPTDSQRNSFEKRL